MNSGSTQRCGRRAHVRRENDPARTKTLQEEYRREISVRIEELRGVIRETVQTNDALELGDQERRSNIDARDRFPFEQAATKQVAFRQQLQTWLEEGVVEWAEPAATAAGNHWTGRYVRSAYQKGIEWANEKLSAAGVTVSDETLETLFNAPIHARTLRDLYTRNYRALEDITEDIDQSLSRILTRGVVEGWNPRKMADRLNDEVRDIQRSRARTMARTETLHAHNSAAARRYEQQGVTQVDVLTHDPCPICERIEANAPYPVSEAPVVPDQSHPNCVCTHIPVIS